MSDKSTETNQIRRWLNMAVDRGASDLHLVVGHPPTIRLHGRLQELDERVLEESYLRAGLLPMCDEQRLARFEREKNLDFAIQYQLGEGPQRFRANFFVSGSAVGACFRIIPSRIPDFSWAGFPDDLGRRLAYLRNGLVLITGVTGAGKTTTLAMLIQLLNQAGGYRILTVEQPIEYLFPRYRSSIVTQREVGQDVETFADGLKFGLRQDPDVILVGEIRDRDTAQMAISAAETGHLVFSTLHTRDAKGAVSRYADLFPQNVQSEIRAQLAMSLRAVVSQHLLPSAVDEKRELALEIMFNNHAIASAIRLGKLESIDTGIVTGRSDGMISLDESIKRLLHDGRITHRTASHFVTDKALLAR